MGWIPGLGTSHTGFLEKLNSSIQLAPQTLLALDSRALDDVAVLFDFGHNNVAQLLGRRRYKFEALHPNSLNQIRSSQYLYNFGPQPQRRVGRRARGRYQAPRLDHVEIGKPGLRHRRDTGQ